MIRLGVIGLGARATCLARLLMELDGSVRLTAAADVDLPAAQARWTEAGGVARSVNWFDSTGALLSAGVELDALIIATRCNTHAQYAAQCAQLNLPTLLEKPVGTSVEHLRMLADAYRDHATNVVVSFPLRMTPLFERVHEIIRSGRLGTINQVEAYNNVGYGGVYFGQWFRDHDVTGGMWLQKATHDFDYINRLLGAAPTTIAAMETRRVYGGDRPDDLRCSDCDWTATCAESPQNIRRRGDDGGMGYGDHLCAFSESIRNHDAGSAVIMYDDGVLASYSQNFVSRRSAHRRGARITGYQATLEFEWIEQKLRVIEHHRKAVDKIAIDTDSSHFGGDHGLCRHFLDVIRGDDRSRAPLSAGIISTAMCLAARTAAQSQAFQSVDAYLPTPPTPVPGQPG